MVIMPNSVPVRQTPNFITAFHLSLLQVRVEEIFIDTQVKHDRRPASRITRHSSHVTRHTSHNTRHTSHVTRHTQEVDVAEPGDNVRMKVGTYAHAHAHALYAHHATHICTALMFA